MPIDVDKALGATLEPVRSTWTEDQVILFHLGVGAGLGGPTDPAELDYTYEPRLKVLPTYSLIPSADALPGMDLNRFPGIDVDFTMLLHGEQHTVLQRPIPTAGAIVSQARIANLWDKGSAAVIELEIESSDPEGTPLFTNRSSLFVRGAGGFGGEKGPSTSVPTPDREPDAVIESPTMAHQALIYRLSGDKNPLHADPDVAKAAGFDRPILHGAATYSIVCKAIVDRLLGGDVDQVAEYRARFAGVVIPGETVVTKAWRENNQILIAAEAAERRAPVLTNAALTVR